MTLALNTLTISWLIFLYMLNHLTYKKKLNSLQLIYLGQILSYSIYFVGLIFGITFSFDLNVFAVVSLLFCNTLLLIIYHITPPLTTNKQSSQKVIVYNDNQMLVSQYLLFAIGSFGTYKLVTGMDLNLSLLISSEDNAYNYLEENFFNSSFAILWQALIASLFFAGNIKKSNKFSTFLCVISIIFISLRGAYLYLIIGFMYYLAGVMISGKRIEKTGALKYIITLSTLVISILYLSYDISSFADIIVKIIPYTYGNLLNYSAVYVESRYLDHIDCGSYYFGLTSIFEYINRYFGTTLAVCELSFPFRQQTEYQVSFGNTVTGFSQIAYFGNFLYFPVIFLLAFTLKQVDSHYNTSVLCACYLPVALSASILMFASGGFASTTRIIPSLIYILPLLFFIKQFGVNQYRH